MQVHAGTKKWFTDFIAEIYLIGDLYLIHNFLIPLNMLRVPLLSREKFGLPNVAIGYVYLVLMGSCKVAFSQLQGIVLVELCQQIKSSRWYMYFSPLQIKYIFPSSPKIHVERTLALFDYWLILSK